jgi:hypothetical protein
VLAHAAHVRGCRYVCSNCVFIVACLLYLNAAREWLKLEGSEAAGASGVEWATYNQYTLAGAVLFILEPSLDFAGAWCAAVLFTLEQARWEWDRARSTYDGQDVDQYETAPPPQRLTSWTGRWIWTGYTVWDDEQTVPTTASLVRSDLNFWAAVFFLVASAFYLYQATIPYLYGDYCRCSDQRRGCGLDTAPESSSSVSGPTASIQPVGYCVAGWLAALTFAFDAAIGLGAWYANRYHVQVLLGRVRTVDWLGLSAGLFMVGAALEVADCAVEDAGLNFVAQLCWLLNGFAYLVDAYDTRQLSRQTCVPFMASSRGQTRASQLSDISWGPL